MKELAIISGKGGTGKACCGWKERRGKPPCGEVS